MDLEAGRGFGGWTGLSLLFPVDGLCGILVDEKSSVFGILKWLIESFLRVVSRRGTGSGITTLVGDSGASEFSRDIEGC